MGNYDRQDFSLGWQPSADAFNAPKNCLLRADNLVQDERGALALRQGSLKINSVALSSTDCHSLFTATLSGSRIRMTGAGDAVFANGTSIFTSIAGSGDIAFGSHMGQILAARGTTKKKYDGSTVRTWGIAPIATAPTLTAVTSDSKTFASCASSELPIMTVNEGSLAFQPDRFGVANAAVELTPDSTTGRATATKTFTAPNDFTKYDAGQTGSDSDLIDFLNYVTEPQFVTSVSVMIDVNDGTFQEDWYEYEFRSGDVTEIVQGVEGFLDSDYTAEGAERDRIEAELEDRGAVETTYRPDKPSSNTGWNHFSVPRGKMVRHGLTPGKNWSTVKAVRVVVNGIAGGSGAAVRFDEIKIIGGSASPLTGRFRAYVVAVRNDGTYQALSGPSPISNEIEVKGQGVSATIDATAIAALDTQVNELWLFLMGGRLDAFYRFAVLDAFTDDLAFDYTQPFEAAYFTSVSGIAQFTSAFESVYAGIDGPRTHNYSWESAYLPASDPVLIYATESELSALVTNIRLETDNTVPPDSIIGIAGPHFDRTMCLTAEFLYPSRERNPDSYATGQVVRVGDATETALWIKKVGESGLAVGTTRDIYVFDGDWTVLPDGSINVRKRPMGVAAPPVSSAVTVGTINGAETLIYLTGNGWQALGVGPLVNGAVDLLWRGFTRHGVSFVNITGSTARFRCAVSKNVFFAITPEGSSTTSSAVIHAYHFTQQRWYRFTYPQAFRSILAEPDGTLIAGDEAGFVRVLDLATKQDDGVNIPIVMWTPIDDNGEAFTYKQAENLQIRVDTAGSSASIAFHLNGDTLANATESVAQTSTDTDVVDVTAVSQFSQCQLRITGSFSTFLFRGFSLRYLDFPMPLVFHDTGFVDLSRDVLKWVRRIRVKVRSAADFTVASYWDGVAGTSQDVSIAGYASTSTVFTIPMGREDKGRTGRVTLTSSLPFHVYWISFEYNGTGAQNQKRVSLIPEAS